MGERRLEAEACHEHPNRSSVPPPQALLSHRPQNITVSLRATGLVLKAIPARDTEGEELGVQGGMREEGPLASSLPPGTGAGPRARTSRAPALPWRLTVEQPGLLHRPLD